MYYPGLTRSEIMDLSDMKKSLKFAKWQLKGLDPKRYTYNLDVRMMKNIIYTLTMEIRSMKYTGRQRVYRKIKRIFKR